MPSQVNRVTSEAERQQARYNLLTTKQVADRLSDENVNADTVRSWIEAGWLRAVDARRSGAKHPYYLIEWRWVEEFVRARSVNAPSADAA